MATKLNSDVTRESSVTEAGREIVITLTEDQKVSLRLKGMKSGDVEIGIGELWSFLNREKDSDVPWSQPKAGYPGNYDEDESESWEEDTNRSRATKQKKIAKDHPGDLVVSLNRLRTLNAITHSDLDVTVKLDEILVDLLKNKK
jgi:hypothetical protein